MAKRNVIFLSVLVLTTMLVGIGVSYSLWNISVSQDTTNIAETKCFDLSISNQENNISLENAYPISNDKGKSLTPYTFTVTNTCDITAEYSVNLEVLNNSTLSSKFIAVMLENNDIKEINLLSNFDNTDKVNTSSIESRKLTTGILKSQESKDYSLRLWIDYNTTLEYLNNEIKSFKSKIIIVGKPINFNYDGDMVFNFDYTGGEQNFTVPVSGTYRLETWGAQGADTYSNINGIISKSGGSGGYSSGYINFNIGNRLYIYVGQGGTSTKDASINLTENCSAPETFNGGGSAFIANCVDSAGSGGGATHIATKSGLLSTLENSKKDIIIVSSGGGGSYSYYAFAADGGAGGGFNGNLPPDLNNGGICGWDRVLTFGNKSTQFSGGTTTGCVVNGQTAAKFGIGESTKGPNNYGSGGGGGYYGGGAGRTAYGAGGGSSYIGNPLLKDKVMYCYGCEESNEESTKTISTTCSEETPTSYCAKKGNGYARITLVSIDE